MTRNEFDIRFSIESTDESSETVEDFLAILEAFLSIENSLARQSFKRQVLALAKQYQLVSEPDKMKRPPDSAN